MHKCQGVLLTLAAMSILTAAGNLIPNSPQPSWTTPVGLHPTYRGKTPIVNHGRLYFIAHNDFRNRIYAVDSATGAVVWKSHIRATRIDLFADESMRAFTLDRYYIGLHVDSGKEFDRADLLPEENVWEKNYFPLMSDGLTIVTAGDGDLVALTPKGEKWRVNPKWATNTMDVMPLVPYQELVLAGSRKSDQHAGGLRAYRRTTGALEWTSAETKEPRLAKIYGDIALVFDGNWTDPNTFVSTVRALDAATGKQLWSLQTNEDSAGVGWSVARSHEDGGTLVLPIGADDKGPFTLRGVDLRTGALKFQLPLDVASFAFVKGTIYKADGKQVVGIDPLNGKVLWRSKAFAGQPSAPFGGDGIVFAGDRHVLSGWAVK